MERQARKIIASRSGQSILEIMIAMGVFVLFSASLASLILGSFSNFARSSEISQASRLADEAVEAVRSISDRNWSELESDTAVVSANAGRWTAVASAGEVVWDKYIRIIEIQDVYRDAQNNIVSATATDAVLDAGSRLVKVRVEWTLEDGLQGSLGRLALLTDWIN